MSIARYTKFVGLFKRFLMLFVLTMIALLVWIASDSNGVNGARLVFSNITKSENLQNVMIKPHYQGVDAHNRPFTVIVDKAIQLDKDNASLENVHADMTMTNGAWVAVNSGSGMLNMTTKQLELKDHVDLFYEGGYEFRTDHAHVDLQLGNAYGDSHVEGQGPLGTLQADSFNLQNHGQIIHFNGSVKMKLYH